MKRFLLVVFLTVIACLVMMQSLAFSQERIRAPRGPAFGGNVERHFYHQSENPPPPPVRRYYSHSRDYYGYRGDMDFRYHYSPYSNDNYRYRYYDRGYARPNLYLHVPSGRGGRVSGGFSIGGFSISF